MEIKQIPSYRPIYTMNMCYNYSGFYYSNFGRWRQSITLNRVLWEWRGLIYAIVLKAHLHENLQMLWHLITLACMRYTRLVRISTSFYMWRIDIILQLFWMLYNMKEIWKDVFQQLHKLRYHVYYGTWTVFFRPENKRTFDILPQYHMLETTLFTSCILVQKATNNKIMTMTMIGGKETTFVIACQRVQPICWHQMNWKEKNGSFNQLN